MLMRPKSQVLSPDRQTGIQSKILSHVCLVASLSLVSCSERMCTSQKGDRVRKSWCLSRDKLCCGKTPQNAGLERSIPRGIQSSLVYEKVPPTSGTLGPTSMETELRH